VKTILIIGAGPLQIPGYLAARELGLRIVGIDRNPEAPGLRLANVAHAVDTRDANGAIEVARAEHVDGVMTLCTDFPVRTVAAVAQALGLSGLDSDTALCATHKGHMRSAFQRGGASIPRFRRVADADSARRALEHVGLPAILKPSASSGSRGVFKVRDQNQCAVAFEYASAIDPEGEILVEEFVEGPEVSVEGISFRGKHHFIAITDKVTTGDPHWVELGHTQPSALPAETQEQICVCAARGLDALGIKDSASHVEIKVGPRGPVLIEIGARLGGDFISTELTARSTGVSMPRAAIQLAIGEKPDVERQWSRGSAIRYIEAAPGRVVLIRGVEEAKAVPGVAIVDVYPAVGEEVRPVLSSLDRVGHVIAEGATREAAVAAAERAKAVITIETTHG